MIRKIFFRNLAAGIGTVLTALIVLLIFVGPYFSSYDPLEVNTAERLQPPSANHWCGTDETGRDIFARIAAGGKYTVGAAVIIIGVATILGLILGGLSGYFGGWLDEVLMRVCDVFMAFPQLLLGMLITFLLGYGLKSAVIALIISWWPTYIRLVRGLVFQIKTNLYVEAAIASGAKSTYVIRHCILPQTIPLLVSRITIDLGYAMVACSSLSFIGLGAQSPMPEWGAMISASRTFVFNAWWYSVFPGLAIFSTVLGVSLLGDAMQDAFDPQLKWTYVPRSRGRKKIERHSARTQNV